jgi:catechol 2,3-dioxygenase-like lactoylglutathione lyase family enzyme
MMEVKNVRWVGISTDAYDGMVDLFGDVLGMTRSFAESNTVEFRTSDGDAVQVMGPGHPYFAIFRQHTTGPVPLLEVDDLAEARLRLEAANVEIVRNIDSDSRWEWLIFRGPDGNLYELSQRRADLGS